MDIIKTLAAVALGAFLVVCLVNTGVWVAQCMAAAT